MRVDGEDLTLRVHDMLLGDDIEFKPDLVVLTTPTEGFCSEDISQMLKVPMSKNGGFFLEAHAKIRPLDFATDGVYVCGSAHAPRCRRRARPAIEAASVRRPHL